MAGAPMRCHWVKDDEVPGGKFFVPGCWGGLMAGDRSGCYCRVNEKDELVDLQKRVAKLEKQLADARLKRGAPSE